MNRCSTVKGLILAGGNGTRLLPLTRTVNKHLIGIAGKPMIHHCVDKLVEAGIGDILVVTGGEHFGSIAEYLGSGKDFDCRFTFRVQDFAGGIAHALGLAEGFVRPGEKMCVLLGDNIFQEELTTYMEDYEEYGEGEAMVMLKEVPDPQRFGVAEIEGHSMHLLGIEEKPKIPKSKFAVTGIYFYDYSVFGITKELKASQRGEMEITDVNNRYIAVRKMHYRLLEGWWTDAGTHESLKRADDLTRSNPCN